MYEVRMSGLLPASPAARRREEAVRAEFRREAMDRLEAKVDRLVEMTKGPPLVRLPLPPRSPRRTLNGQPRRWLNRTLSGSIPEAVSLASP
jgi:hypothetical protein